MSKKSNNKPIKIINKQTSEPNACGGKTIKYKPITIRNKANRFKNVGLYFSCEIYPFIFMYEKMNVC